MMAVGFAFMLLRLAITKCLRHKDSLDQEDQAGVVKHWTSLAVCLVAIPLALYHSY
jgi:hypothetical protein